MAQLKMIRNLAAEVRTKRLRTEEFTNERQDCDQALLWLAGKQDKVRTDFMIVTEPNKAGAFEHRLCYGVIGYSASRHNVLVRVPA
jgi:hypothetical protein